MVVRSMSVYTWLRRDMTPKNSKIFSSYYYHLLIPLMPGWHVEGRKQAETCINSSITGPKKASFPGKNVACYSLLLTFRFRQLMPIARAALPDKKAQLPKQKVVLRKTNIWRLTTGWVTNFMTHLLLLFLAWDFAVPWQLDLLTKYKFFKIRSYWSIFRWIALKNQLFLELHINK